MEIADTGIRGYLRWLKHDQPGLYQAAAPKIAALVPDAFSNFEQSRAFGYLSGADTTGGAVPSDLTFTSDITGVSSDPAPDVASVANTGTASPSSSNTISNIISAIGQVFLAKSQVDTLKQVNDIQLQRAQAGLPPLSISTLGLGVPQVNVGIAPGTVQTGKNFLLYAAAAGALYWLFGRRRAA